MAVCSGTAGTAADVSVSDAATKHGPLILANSLGRPWTSHGFQTSWRIAVTKAGIVGLTFHDLRGTAVTRLATTGCTTPEIASLTGHSLRDVNAILDAHYLHRDPALAESAIRNNGHDWADRFPAIVDAAHRIKAQSFLIGSEVVIARDDGTQDLPVRV